MDKKFQIKEFDITEVQSEWHPTKNGTLNFTDLPTGSGRLVWWLGKCGHEWETKLFLRATRGAGCPYCNNRALLQGFNDIAAVHPEWVSEWSPSNPLPCNQVLSGGKPEHAWLCDKGHEFHSSVGHKERGRGCPVCLNKKLLVGYNDLETVSPEIAAEWHPTKNGEVTPKDIVAGGASKRWWLGACGHEWETTITKRIKSESGCPACSGLKVIVGFNDLASQHPDIAAEWHPTKNGELTPETVMIRSTAVTWWQCPEGHEWETKVSNRTLQNNGCNVCKKAVRTHTIKEDNLLLSNPKLASEWHPAKNGFLSPKHVTVGSKKSAWWIGSCGHEWSAQVYARVAGNGCPICRGLKILEGHNDLASTHPEITLQWHPTKNGKLKPEDVTAGTKRKAWWLGECGHEWESTISHRTAGQSCAVCHGRKVVAGVNDLATINPQIAAEWHPTKNGTLTPDKVTGKGGRVKAWWQCSKGHEWEAGVKGRIRGTNCPQCWATSYISKAEQSLFEYIRLLDADIEIIQSDKKVLKGKELDIYVPSKNIAIEFNGLFWHSENAGKDKHYHHDKWFACKEAGIQLIQIWEDEWNRNEEQIKRMIAHKLGLSSQRKVFARKTVVKDVSKNDAEVFLNTHHVQGYASGSYYLGLYEKGEEELLALLVLKNEAGTNGKTLNIIRYATAANVVGGFTKLLKFAEKSHGPESFVTFADHSVSDGGLYENNGFVVDKELAPDYMYIVNGERKHKFGYRLKRFQTDPELEWAEGLSERELAELNGLERIWDAGKTRYLYKVGYAGRKTT